MAFFTSNANLDVGIVNNYVLNSGGSFQGSGQNAVGFYNPTGGLPPAPAAGDRYISQASANGWILNHVHTYKNGKWVSIPPTAGELIWLTNESEYKVWNSTASDWKSATIAMGSVGRYSFKTSGTLVLDNSITQIRITMWGGGAGGSASSNGASGIGGGGASLIDGYTHYLPGGGGTITITVGAGGAKGLAGSFIGGNGGNSVVSIGSLVLTAYAGSGQGSGAGAGGTGSSAGGAASTSYPIKGPSGAPLNSTSSLNGVEGDSSFNRFTAGSSAGKGADGIPAGNGADFLGHSGGRGANGSGFNGGGGAAGPGGSGGAGADANGTSASGQDAAANSGAGGGGGAAEFGFTGEGGAGGSGLVIIETF